MSKSIIFLEGHADAVFLNDLIYHLLPEDSNRFTNINKFKSGKAILINDKPFIEIFISGGCSHIKKYFTKIIEYRDLGYKIILIQDADNPEKDSYMGGFKKRMDYLKKFKNEHSINFNTFLLPNHESDGDLEDILIELVLPNKYKQFYDNYKKYCEEIARFSSSIHSDELLLMKYRIYGYCQVFHGMEFANEKNRDYHNNHWNLDNPALDRLKSFLLSELDFPRPQKTLVKQ